MSKLKKCFLLFLLCGLSLPVVPLFAQEAVKSIEEMYFNFLVLRGLAQRPYLNFRTMSDSVWDIDPDSEHPWSSQNFGTFHPMFGGFRVRIYGPELFMSVNTTAPYGQNDGVLWQGRGFNALFKGGIRIEGRGLELTFLPHVAFSQNAHFDIMPSHNRNEFGYFWGYGPPGSNSGGADAPQRFGDRPFFDWDFGNSEIRYTWRTLTVGFGTQAIWLGPSFLHSILHSNNAPTYPRFDIGLRRQRVTIPRLDWYIGDIEARLWVGRLTESDFFYSGDFPSHTMFHGMALAFAPSFLPGLTLFVNRVSLVPWAWEYLRAAFPNTDNLDEDDQKASFGFSWLFPQVGFEVYGELGVDDFVPEIPGGLTGRIRNPYHTMVFTVGARKAVAISERHNVFGQIIFEWSHMEMSTTFQFQWPYSFYFHHRRIQGYTNRGQWLGNAFSPGGNAQYLEFRLFYPRGTSSIFIHRYNPDNNYIWQHAIWGSPDEFYDVRFITSFRANFVIGMTTSFRVMDSLTVGGKFAYNLILNPFYFHNRVSRGYEEIRHNFHISLIVRHTF